MHARAQSALGVHFFFSTFNLILVAAPKGNKYAKGAKGGARPPQYKKEYAQIALKLCLMGATDIDLGEAFDVTEMTINNWKKKYKDFSLALKQGKALADAQVAGSLYHRATGYSHPDVDIKVIGRKIVKTQLVKHYPPDTAAMIFWLKNRQKDKWRDKVEHGMTDGDGKDVNPVFIFKLPDNGRTEEAKGG